MSLESLKRTLPSAAACKKLDDYYNGKARLDALGVTLPPEVRVLEMVAPWPRMSIDVLAEVLTFTGFTLGEDTKGDSRLVTLRETFQANRMDTTIRLAIIDALVQGAAYFIVGPGEGSVPRVTAHSAENVTVERDWLGRPTEALVRWRADSSRDGRRYTHYEPGTITTYAYDGARWLQYGDPQPTDIDEITVCPMINKARIDDHDGRSEMLDILKAADAGSRSLTNLQVAQELTALPQRWIFADGIKSALSESGKSKFDAYIGYLNTGPEGGNVQQLSGADLSQIIDSYKLYAQIVSSVTGIPPSMLGIATDNPSSAEAMRVAKERLTSRGEVKQSLFGDSLEHLGRIALKMSGADMTGIDRLETVWRDVATPSRSSQQSMALQAFQSGAISAQTMRDFLDLTPAQRQREDQREMTLSGTGGVQVASVSSGNADRSDS